MGSRYRKPEEHRITLSDGDWLLVRKHLTAGDEREAYARLLKAGSIAPGAQPQIDPEHLGIAQVAAYLLDWSITDADDQPIRVRDQPYEFIAAALKDQTPDSLKEIIAAIQDHETAMTAAREAEKKTRAGATAPDPTSTSAV